MLTVLDLFSGIGGFSLGLESTGGFRTAAFCEIDPYARRVLGRHWPDVPIFGDIRDVGLAGLLRAGVALPDVVCGGFPCQDISLAGVGAGLGGARSGLWFEMLRVITETRPAFAIIENVAALRGRGLDVVLGGLAAIGYDAEWHCIPAAAVGAPHRRDRVWIVAYDTDAVGAGRREPVGSGETVSRTGRGEPAGLDCGHADVAHADGDDGGPWRQGRSVAGRAREYEPVGPVRHAGTEAVADTVCNGLQGPEPTNASTVRRRPTDPGATGFVRHADGAGLAQRESESGNPRQKLTAVKRTDWWLVESDVGRSLDGFSIWLDRYGFDMTETHKIYAAYVDAQERGCGETLRELRRAVLEAAVRYDVRGPVGISPETVLLAYLRELQARHSEERHVSFQGTKAHETKVRNLRDKQIAASAPRRSGPHEQHAEQPADPVQALSRFLARYAEKAWMDYRRTDAAVGMGWETGVARVAADVPSRVDRLRCLGNSVVPQIPALIGSAILEHIGAA